MTARKIHFDFYGDNEAAWCGAVPRNNAPALELSERRKDVDCAKCLKLMAEYDAEVLASADEQVLLIEVPVEEEAVMLNTYIDNHQYGGPTDLSGHTGNLYRSIADRHGLDTDIVENAFNDGILKR